MDVARVGYMLPSVAHLIQDLANNCHAGDASKLSIYPQQYHISAWIMSTYTGYRLASSYMPPDHSTPSHMIQKTRNIADRKLGLYLHANIKN